ncbi:MAG: hypothetical protein KJ070_21485 [Verrucomicrobia bacterium]|nr:hypothetical protein [Verrucomicrobiota bacterium]
MRSRWRADHPTAVSRAAHETVWQRVEEPSRFGLSRERVSAYVELATGLNFFDETTQAWQPNREEWEVYPDAIVARAGQHKVILATNLNLAGAVDVLTPDGMRLISSPVSLGFYDPVDGKQVVIAEVKDCAAERGAVPNEVVFRNCFDRIRGSIRFLYTKAGVHQHVVLEQKLELPEDFSDNSRLECYTVFDAATPWPQMTTRVLRREKDPLVRAQMVEPDFMDSEIAFGGGMGMRTGKAFSWGDETEARSIRVGKQFLEIEGSPVLVEAVEFKQLEPLLARLASTEGSKTDGLAINTSRQIKRAQQQARLPREHYRAFDKVNEIQLASNPLSQPAVVIDYELLTSGTATLTGSTTWYVSGLVNVTNLQIEGTAVVKLTNSASAKINVIGTLECQTGPYRPAVFTSLHDNSVGQTLPGSSGNPTNSFNGFSAVVINESSQRLHDLRVAYATSGITLGFRAGELNLENVQFVHCAYPIDSAGEDENTIAVDNGLFYTSHYVIRGGEDLVVSGRHLTINRCGFVGYTGFGSGTGDLYLTNSLVVAATNGWGQFSGIFGSVTTNHTAHFTNDPGGIFQTVAAASHYLADGTYRDIGTTNLNADLLALLRMKTTYPPLEITTNFTANTTLLPRAARDADTPDLGFHYDPLDFVVNGRTLSATLTLTNGVAVGTYGVSGSYGISVASRLLNKGHF